MNAHFLFPEFELSPTERPLVPPATKAPEEGPASGAPRSCYAKLLKMPDAALEMGKAAEHLVVADLILQGYRCFLSDQGLPYDVVLETPEGLKRIQVRSALFPKNVNATGRNARVAYGWHVRKRGKNGKGTRLSGAHCDIVALVAIDIRVVAYLPVSFSGQTVQLIPPGEEYKTKARHGWGWSRDVSQFPIEDALRGDPSIYEARKITRCPKGHEYDAANTVLKNGSRICKKCRNAKSVQRVKRWRLKNGRR